jgi:hypothetical protein
VHRFVYINQKPCIYHVAGPSGKSNFECEEQWRQFENQQGLTAIQSASDTSDPLECQKFCFDVPNCVGLDFNTNAASRHQCWLYIDELPAKLYRSIGIDHWMLTRCITTDHFPSNPRKFIETYFQSVDINQPMEVDAMVFQVLKINAELDDL